MRELVELIVGWGLSTYATHWILTRDEGRLTRVEDARAWPVTTRWAAVVLLGPLCIPVHFGRTRRSLRGVVLGLLAALLAMLPAFCVGEALDLTGPIPAASHPLPPHRPAPRAR